MNATTVLKKSGEESPHSKVAISFITIACIALASTYVVADEETEAETTALRKQIDSSVEWFELNTTGKNANKLKAKKVLRWDNVSRGSQVGLTVLYIGRGRAEAVCCVYPWEKNLIHEFVSLSRGGLEGKQEDVPFWSVKEPGLEFKPVPKATAPAETGFGRRSQMKSIARRFEGTLLGWKNDDSDRQVLRLLPRALYEYEEPKDVIDGAVFSFTMGVDPEILLLLEAVEHKGKPRWEYGVVRKTSGELEMKLDKNIVWHAKRSPTTNNPTLVNRNVKRPLE